MLRTKLASVAVAILSVFVAIVLMAPNISYACNEGFKHSTGAPCGGSTDSSTEERLMDLEAAVGTLQTDVSDHESRVLVLEDNVGTTDIGTLETNVGTLQTDVGTLQSNTLEVYDAADVKVGAVIEFSGTGPVSVAFQVNTHRFVLRVGAESWQGNTTGPWFLSNNCTGQPYVDTPFESIQIVPLVALAIPTIGGAGPAVYLADPNGVIQTLTMLSRLRGTSFGIPLADPNDECEVIDPNDPPRDVIPALELINYADVYMAPFRAR